MFTSPETHLLVNPARTGGSHIRRAGSTTVPCLSSACALTTQGTVPKGWHALCVPR
jgi:hypothetical protein